MCGWVERVWSRSKQGFKSGRQPARIGARAFLSSGTRNIVVAASRCCCRCATTTHHMAAVLSGKPVLLDARVTSGGEDENKTGPRQQWIDVSFTHAPVAASQIVTVRSLDTLAKRPPSSAAKLRTRALCPSRVVLMPPPNFHLCCAVSILKAAKKHRAISPVRSTEPAHSAIPRAIGAISRTSDAAAVLPIGYSTTSWSNRRL